MKKIFDLLSSMKLAAILLLVFAMGAAVATFVENDYGSTTARAVVYNARWFETVMVLLSLNVAINMIKSLKDKNRNFFDKLPSVIFHSAFLIILLGAAMTRYMGYEGIMHIREGGSENSMLSADSYISVSAKSAKENKTEDTKALLSRLGNNKYEQNMQIGGKELKIKLTGYLPNAFKKISEVKDGKPMISMMIAPKDSQPSERLIESGNIADEGGVSFTFDDTNANTPFVKFFAKDSKIYFTSNEKIKYITLSDQSGGVYEAGEINEFTKGRLYSVNDVNFVPRNMTLSGKSELVSAGKTGKTRQAPDALTFDVSYDGKDAKITAMGEPNVIGRESKITLDGVEVAVSYGAKSITLPLSLKLQKFEVERYPGSMSPSSFASFVEVSDNNKEYDYKIYMNHTLDAEGLRFFQSSFDPDEKGTILSVSHDPGKIPTYMGYGMLFFGLILSFFNKNGRFLRLNETLKAAKGGVAAVLALFLVLGSNLKAAENNAGIDMMQMQTLASEVKHIDPALSESFSKILVEDAQGRIKPMDSLSEDIVDKLSGGPGIAGLNENETVLSMLIRPKIWQQVKMIKISHPQLNKILDIPENQNKIAFADVFDFSTSGGAYKLASYVDDANRKKPSERDMFDKEVLKLDERINICYMVFSGQLFRIFPKPNDPTNTWYDPAGAITAFNAQDSATVKELIGNYLSKVDAAMSGGNTEDAVKAADAIRDYQAKIAPNLIPSKNKIKAELWYNKLSLFKNLIFVYLFCGLLLLGIEIAKIFKEAKYLNLASKAVTALLALGLAAHTINLALRWYISGHAPWSDGFESMTYIAWATLLAGFIFSKKSTLAFSLTGILSAVILFVAYLSWMDPQITNIVPVLRSYWLVIHVATITASYGFLGLGALLGFMSLVLFILRKTARPNIDTAIKELVIINEMTILVGLAMLTIGNFLGGIWANESWGRYWGWDPKETWALISILVYAVVAHARFIPQLKSPFAFSALSLFAFSSIIMTYFGVNFYLSGLHSYAAGDPVPVPTSVYIGIAVALAVFAAAYKKRDLKS